MEYGVPKTMEKYESFIVPYERSQQAVDRVAAFFKRAGFDVTACKIKIPTFEEWASRTNYRKSMDGGDVLWHHPLGERVIEVKLLSRRFTPTEPHRDFKTKARGTIFLVDSVKTYHRKGHTPFMYVILSTDMVWGGIVMGSTMNGWHKGPLSSKQDQGYVKEYYWVMYDEVTFRRFDDLPQREAAQERAG